MTKNVNWNRLWCCRWGFIKLCLLELWYQCSG